jgi:UDP-3-O-[3-hydroxymyristoyl] glucosamine N-acyltransferase
METTLTLSEITQFLDDNQIEYTCKNQETTFVPVVNTLSSIFNPLIHSLTYYNGYDSSIFNDGPTGRIAIVGTLDFESDDIILISVDDPQLVFYMIASNFIKEDRYPLGYRSESSCIKAEAQVHPKTYIGPNVVIEDNVIIEEGVIIHSSCHIYFGTRIKKNTIIESNSCIGAGGVAWVWDKTGKRWDLPQIGGVIINEDCFIGTNVTIVRGSLGEENTIIGKGSKIAHGSKIGHGCHLGEDTHLANNVSLAGSVVIGDRCFIGSGVSVRPRTRITNGVTLGTGSAVVNDIDEKNSVWIGVPAKKMERSRHSGMPTPLHKK